LKNALDNKKSPVTTLKNCLNVEEKKFFLCARMYTLMYTDGMAPGLNFLMSKKFQIVNFTIKTLFKAESILFFPRFQLRNLFFKHSEMLKYARLNYRGIATQNENRCHAKKVSKI
jgi:hypothetical protein